MGLSADRPPDCGAGVRAQWQEQRTDLAAKRGLAVAANCDRPDKAATGGRAAIRDRGTRIEEATKNSAVVSVAEGPNPVPVILSAAKNLA
jgi:hypothetical protein